jgi:hypothetical protein
VSLDVGHWVWDQRFLVSSGKEFKADTEKT